MFLWASLCIASVKKQRYRYVHRYLTKICQKRINMINKNSMVFKQISTITRTGCGVYKLFYLK